MERISKKMGSDQAKQIYFFFIMFRGRCRCCCCCHFQHHHFLLLLRSLTGARIFSGKKPTTARIQDNNTKLQRTRVQQPQQKQRIYIKKKYMWLWVWFTVCVRLFLCCMHASLRLCFSFSRSYSSVVRLHAIPTAITAKCLAGTLIVLLFTYELNRTDRKFSNTMNSKMHFNSIFFFISSLCTRATNKQNCLIVFVSVSLSKTVYRDFFFINNNKKQHDREKRKKKCISKWKQQIESFIHTFIYMYMVCIRFRLYGCLLCAFQSSMRLVWRETIVIQPRWHVNFCLQKPRKKKQNLSLLAVC